MNLYEKFLQLKAQEEQIKEARYDVEAQIYIEFASQLKPIGTTSFDVEGFKVSITKNLAYKVDQSAAEKIPQYFRAKFEFNKDKYESANDEGKKLIDAILTITPNKPTFKLERK